MTMMIIVGIPRKKFGCFKFSEKKKIKFRKTDTDCEMGNMPVKDYE